MTDKRSVQTCPYIGLPNDRASHYGQPSDAHQCYSPLQPGEIPLDYQQKVCFSSQYANCNRFTAPIKTESPGAAQANPPEVKRPSVMAQAHNLWEPRKRLLAARFGIRVEYALWGLALVLAIVAIYSSLALFTSKNTTSAIAVPTYTPFPSPSAAIVPSSTLTTTPAPSDTVVPSPNPSPTRSALVIPSPPSDGIVLTLFPDSSGVAWTASKELAPHWGDRNLHAGSFQGQSYTSIIKFTLGNVLPPGSKILFAALELTGRNSSHLGKTGEWSLQLVDNNQMRDWSQATNDELVKVPALDSIGQPVQVSELGDGLINRFEFSEPQLKLLEGQLKLGQVTLRLQGPSGPEDNLFTWDAGVLGTGGLNTPTLYIVAVPGAFTVITNTPTPANVFTAAANIVGATARAKQFGTPTPWGPGVITATPGGGRIEVTPINTPANAATAAALSAYATAVAIATGTFTPTPNNIVVVYPTVTPFFISIDRLLVPPTPTSSSGINYSSIPIPPVLNGKIFIVSNRFGEPFKGMPVVMNSDGSVLGVLSGDIYYQAAQARENLSPDNQRRAIVAPGQDDPDILQIWIEDQVKGDRTQITHLLRGLAYDPAWSPDGNSIVYVSTETGRAEIFTYDLLNRMSHQVTVTTARLVYNQRPSWSPDSKQIVFKSNRDSGHFQIWIMNADGSSLRNLSQNEFDELDPIWVKP